MLTGEGGWVEWLGMERAVRNEGELGDGEGKCSSRSAMSVWRDFAPLAAAEALLWMLFAGYTGSFAADVMLGTVVGGAVYGSMVRGQFWELLHMGLACWFGNFSRKMVGGKTVGHTLAAGRLERRLG
eukprot:459949-Hanusia_phi.AAC.2